MRADSGAVGEHGEDRLSGRKRALARLAALLAVGVALAPMWGTALDREDAERDLIVLTNADRTSNGLASLRPHDGLIGVARERSQDMAVRNYFSHEIPPDGQYFENLLDGAGIRFRQAGENIARNNYPDSETTRRAQTGFLNSPAHRANIMDPVYRELGVGAWDRADGMKYFTVLFLLSAGGVADRPLPLQGSGSVGWSTRGLEEQGVDSVRALVDAVLGPPLAARAQAIPPMESEVPSEASARRVSRQAPQVGASPRTAGGAEARAVVAAQPATLGLLDGIITRVLKLYLSL
jgi:uncharacterized protein YkwD